MSSKTFVNSEHGFHSTPTTLLLTIFYGFIYIAKSSVRFCRILSLKIIFVLFFILQLELPYSNWNISKDHRKLVSSGSDEQKGKIKVSDKGPFFLLKDKPSSWTQRGYRTLETQKEVKEFRTRMWKEWRTDQKQFTVELPVWTKVCIKLLSTWNSLTLKKSLLCLR